MPHRALRFSIFTNEAIYDASVVCEAVSDSLLCFPGKSREVAQIPSKFGLALLPCDWLIYPDSIRDSVMLLCRYRNIFS